MNDTFVHSTALPTKEGQKGSVTISKNNNAFKGVNDMVPQGMKLVHMLAIFSSEILDSSSCSHCL